MIIAEGRQLRQIRLACHLQNCANSSPRTYQEERDQRVVFLLDCSRRMRANGRTVEPLFDQCLNAMLATQPCRPLKQGDEICPPDHGLLPDGRDRLPAAGGVASASFGAPA